MRRSVVLFVCLAAAVVLVPGAIGSARSSAPPAKPTLYVNYTMGCTFSIVDDSGRAVTSIPPGTYQVMVSTPIMFKLVVPGGQGTGNFAPGDYSGCRGWVQFSLTGPGVNLSTTLDFGCTSELLLSPITLSPSSTYTAVDMSQPGVARSTFTTLASGTPPTPTSSPYDATSGKGDVQASIVGSGAVVGTIKGTLAASGKLSLTKAGKPINSLPAGRYAFSITDKDPRAGVVILGPKSTRISNLTGGSYVGRRSVTLNLSAGRWIYYSSTAAQRTFVVTSKAPSSGGILPQS